MRELTYSWLPSSVRIVEFEDYLVVRYKGKEIPYGKGVTEETLKKDILSGGLEEQIKAGKTGKDL